MCYAGVSFMLSTLQLRQGTSSLLWNSARAPFTSTITTHLVPGLENRVQRSWAWQQASSAHKHISKVQNPSSIACASMSSSSFPPPAPAGLEQVGSNKQFGGYNLRYKHDSAILGCKMTFTVYLPPQAASGPVPVLYWLSGLTCTDENFIQKSGVCGQHSALHAAMCKSWQSYPPVLCLPKPWWNQCIQSRSPCSMGGQLHLPAWL